MEHDARLRAAARAVYRACHVTAVLTFEEAERFRTERYREAIAAAQAARPHLAEPATEQPRLV